MDETKSVREIYEQNVLKSEQIPKKTFCQVNHTAKQIVPFRAKHTAKQIVPFRAKN